MKFQIKNIFRRIGQFFNQKNNWQSTSSPSFYYGWYSDKQKRFLERQNIDYYVTNKINGTTIKLTSFTKNYENIPSFPDIIYIGVFTKLPKKVYLSQ